jgi:hypothetical protein
MSLLKLAIENQRWDLAAHVIVLAAARSVFEEVKVNEKENKKSGRSKG